MLAMLSKSVCLTLCLCIMVGCSKTEEKPTTNTNLASTTKPTVTTTNNSNYTANPKWETIVVGSEINYPPFEFQDQKGLPTGFEVELLQKIGKMEEFNVQFIHHARSEATDTLNANKYRIWASALSVTPERAAVMDFTQPIINSEFIAGVLDNEKNASINTAEDLKGKSIAVSQNAKTTMEYALKVSGGEQYVVALNSFYLSVKEVFSGKADAVISDKRVLNYYMTQYPDIKVKTISLNSEKKDLAFAVKKGDTEMLNKLNSGLEKLKSNGTYERLMTKWFGTTS
ncbi:transporter substrate-binding domain-containing protein [Moraxella boevrei]|uniref:transporter substrate-binding domain-containing protein n=1 Tax=Faucicola boevrei TaxID=346665 RepID=UPI0037350C67